LIDVHFPPQDGSQLTGYSSVRVLNQNLNYFPNTDPNEHKSLTLYVRDLTTSSGWTKEGDIDVGDYEDIDLTQNNHQYAIACVDEDMIGCNGNDPNSQACVRQAIWVKCDPNGPTLNITVY
jgi:hypothetical protein